MVAQNIEQTSHRLIGVDVHMCRFKGILRDVEVDKSAIPSVHGLVDWGLFIH